MVACKVFYYSKKNIQLIFNYLKNSKLAQNFITDLSFNYITTFFTIISGVLFLPYYLKFVSNEEYGIWLSTGGVISVFSVVGGGFDLLVLQKITMLLAKGEEKEAKKEFTASLIIIILFCSVILFFAFILRSFINDVFELKYFENYKLNTLINFSILGLILEIFYLHIKIIFLAKLNNKIIGIVDLISRIISILSLIIFLNSSYGILSFAMSQFIFPIFGLSILFFYKYSSILSMMDFKFTRKIIQNQFSEYFPSMLGRSGNIIFNGIQLPLITALVGPIYTTNYSITNKVYESINFIISPIKKSIIPSLTTKIYHSENIFTGKLKFIYNLYQTSFILILALSFLSVNTILEYWVGTGFFLGDNVSFLLVILLFAQNNQSLNASIIMCYGYRKQISIFGIVELCLKSIGAFFLIKFFNDKTEIILLLPFVLIISVTITFLLQFNFVSQLKRNDIKLISKIDFTYFILFLIILTTIYFAKRHF
jgi:O-antigen/teichoic acid export membrane protein